MFGHLERIMSLVHRSLSESVDGKMAAIIYCFIALFKLSWFSSVAHWLLVVRDHGTNPGGR